jgi:signal transduction histidine kinase
MDLHDEVGTALTRALFYSRKAKDQVLTNLIENSLNSLRAYIYSMSNKKVKLFELIDDLQEMLNFISIDTDIEVNFKYSELKNETISSILYRDLKLSFYEIIANNQKHSHCSKFDVHFILEKSILKINFTDNGVLNNIDVLFKNSNGIDNIYKRVKRHKGEVNYSINPVGSGLCIDILVLI